MILLKKQLIGSGIYGKYFKISRNKGIKIIGSGYKKFNKLLKSKRILDAVREATLLKISEKRKVSPKFYNLKVVKFNGKFYPAIEMEHIVGKKAYDYDSTGSFKINKKGRLSKKGFFAETYIKKMLLKEKIIHKDLHYNNMIITKNKKIKAIDFSPDWISFKGDRKHYFKIKENLLNKLIIESICL